VVVQWLLEQMEPTDREVPLGFRRSARISEPARLRQLLVYIRP